MKPSLERRTQKINMTTFDPYSTHVPALALAVYTYGTRVLEIGCGWYSTPLLHTMSSEVITLENNPDWAEKFKAIAGDKLRVVSDIVAAANSGTPCDWDVVFIDCEPVADRAPILEMFLDKHCCIVAHDTEAEPYPDLLKKVKFQRHFDFLTPRTSFLSNVLDVTK